MSAFPRAIVVEDDPDVGELIRLLITSAGFDAVLYPCGLAALRAIRAGHPALCVLDIDLPGLTGLEICRAVKSDPDLTGTHVIMISAVDHERGHRDAALAGADDFLAKPFDAAVLRARAGAVAVRTAPAYCAG
jgi:DNA-binding response OmpR family regulator